MKPLLTIANLGLLLFACSANAGPYDSYLHTGIAPGSVVAWATDVLDYSPTDEVVHFDSFGFGPHDVPSSALGAADGATVSLGDLEEAAIAAGTLPGSITLAFAYAIFDGPGADLAVFENASSFFDEHDPDFIFAELAFVEVSTNGIDFARFPAISLNLEIAENTPDPNHDQIVAPFGRNFAGINTTNVKNLAGIHPSLTGTPFDLQELSDDPLVVQGAVDLDEIRYVRLVDIPGNGAFLDSQGNPILDAWKTVESGGLDLDAVGALNAVPEPATALLAIAVLVGLSACMPSTARG